MIANNFSQPARRLVRFALFTAAVALGGAVCPAIGTAEPVWDVEEYDYCMKQTTAGVPTSDPVGQFEEADRYCCHRSGGVYNGVTCTAPPAEGAEASVPPPKVDLPTVAVQPPHVAPPPPPGVVAPTVTVLPPRAG